jgi:hypothetical protein
MSAVALPVVDWRTLAACRGRDLSYWYAEEGSFEQRVALRLCRECPVRRDCLASALDEETGAIWAVWGVRGGMTASERRSTGHVRST